MKNSVLFCCLCLLAIFNSNEKAICRWEQVSSFNSMTHNAISISAIDSNNYILVANRLYFTDLENTNDDMTQGLIAYLSSDYGKTWDSIFSNMKPINKSYRVNKLEGIHIFSKDSIFMMVSLAKKNAILLKTFDGGKTWDSMYCALASKEPSAGVNLAFFYFKNTMEGFYALDYDSMVVTKDGGMTWKKLELPQLRDTLGTGYWMSSYSIYKNTFLITAVRSYDEFLWKKILISKDMGQSWEIIEDQADKIAQGTIRFAIRNENEIWGLGNNPDNAEEAIIRKSLDGGKTWERIDGGKLLARSLKKIHFIGKDSIIIEAGSKLFRSSDNGLTWVKYYENPSNLSSVAITKWHRGLVEVGYDIFRCDPRPDAVEFSPDKSKLSVFPNPLAPSQTMNISYSESYLAGNLIIKIVDMAGKVIDEYTPENISSEINVQYSHETPFACGTYFLVIESGGVVVAKEKFVVE